MKTNKILQLKNRVFDVKQDGRGRITLTEGDGVVCEEIAAIIAQNGGAEALMLLCYETTETVDEVIAKRKRSAEIQKARIVDNTELVEREGVIFNLGRRRCAKVKDTHYLQDNVRKTWSTISLERFLQFQREHNDSSSERPSQIGGMRPRIKK